jgi:hypothetical protein
MGITEMAGKKATTLELFCGTAGSFMVIPPRGKE